MQHYKYLLFDLDGTLTDPKEGICKSVQYALKKQNIDEPDIDKLTPFIGPPLMDSFASFYDMDEEHAKLAVADYRERFSAVGLYENVPYPGIKDLLKKLYDEGCILAIASSKPLVFVEKILNHFEMREYFHIVMGSELDGRRSTKNEVIEEALNQLAEYTHSDSYKAISEDILMIGDRSFDIEGAAAFGLDSVGVLYGYGSKNEFATAKATYIVATVKELDKMLHSDEKSLSKYICKHSDKPVSNSNPQKLQKTVNEDNFMAKALENAMNNPAPDRTRPSFFRALDALMPLVIYYVASYCIIQLALRMFGYTGDLNAVRVESITIPSFILIISNTVVALILYIAFRNKDFMPKRMSKSLPLTFIAGAFSAMALNLIIAFICNIAGATDLMKKASFTDNTVFGIGLLLFGLTSPLMEEIMFRWLIYGRIKRMLGPILGTIVTSLFFGFYHGNILQGIYAFIMGVLMIVVYEYTKSFAAPLLFHIGANIFVFTTAYLPQSVKDMLSTPVSCIAMAAIAILSMITIIKHKEN